MRIVRLRRQIVCLFFFIFFAMYAAMRFVCIKFRIGLYTCITNSPRQFLSNRRGEESLIICFFCILVATIDGVANDKAIAVDGV